MSADVAHDTSTSLQLPASFLVDDIAAQHHDGAGQYGAFLPLCGILLSIQVLGFGKAKSCPFSAEHQGQDIPVSCASMTSLPRYPDSLRQRLAPISGSIEESDKSPIAAVWREINEETTLTPANLHLFRQGKPYSFTDEGIGRIWTVHPFAFSLKSANDEKQIQLDWEHEGFSWHDPMDVNDGDAFDGVPFLAKSLRRVWFDMDLGEARAEILRRGLETLQGDNVSGARQLASKALDIFRQLVTEVSGETAEVFQYNARIAAWHLWKNGRESMGAAILNTLVRSLTLIDEELRGTGKGQVTQESLHRLSQRLLELQQERDTTPERIWQSLRPALEAAAAQNNKQPVKILTLSASSTVTLCLQRALQRENLSLDIRILEPRPPSEGVSTRTKLMMEALDDSMTNAGSSSIAVYADASAAVASHGVDIVLLGADLIAEDGAVSTKVGSLPAVLSAKHVSPKVKVVVLAGLEKILPVPAPTHDEEHDANELTGAWGLGERADGAQLKEMPTDKSVTPTARNVQFEWVPPSLIESYISEDRTRGPGDIVQQVESMRAEVERLFAESETRV